MRAMRKVVAENSTLVDVSRYLQRALVRVGNNKTKLARDAGISRNTLYRILRGDLEENRIITLIKLAVVLKVKVQEVLAIYFHESRLPADRLD